MIEPNDITGVDETTAYRIIAIARGIAPCLDSLPDGNDRKQAIAVLIGVAKEVKGRGNRHIASQGVGSANVRYREVESCFFPDDRAVLRSLCAGTAPAAGPLGHFPSPSRATSALWPERYDS